MQEFIMKAGDFMIRRRFFIRTVSFLLAASICLGAAASDASRVESEHGEALKKIRLAGLVSLCEYSSRLSAGLRALAVAADGITAEPAAYVASQALGAKGAASCFDEAKIKNILAFFDGVYAFAHDYPEAPDENLRKSAISLSDYAEEMYYHLSDISNAAMNGEKSLLEGDKTAEFFENTLDFTNGTEDSLFSQEANIDTAVRAVQSKITREAAKAAASELFGIETALWRGGELEAHGGVEVYRFLHGDISVEIASESGKIAAFTVSKSCSTAQTDGEAAAKAALEFLEALGFPEMREIDREEREFRTEIALAPCVNGILYLNSAVLVAICRCCNEPVRFDSTEYIENYREIEAMNANARLASLIPSGFTLIGQTLCVENIAGRARLCYLAECEFYGERARLFYDYFSLKPLKSENIRQIRY